MVDQTQRQGRFTDIQRGTGLVEGYRDASQFDPISPSYLKRNIRPFTKFGLTTDLDKYKGMSFTNLENMAARAVIKRDDIKVRKLRTTVNHQRFTQKQIANAQRAMRAEDPSQLLLKRTREARKYISMLRRNRAIMRRPLFAGIPRV